MEGGEDDGDEKEHDVKHVEKFVEALADRLDGGDGHDVEGAEGNVAVYLREVV